MVQKISKLDVTINGLLKSIADSVSKWKPGELKREIQYSSALADYLREVCPPDTRIETEYRDGGTTVDVWLQWQGLFLPGQVFLELKRNLRKKSDYDRFVGQITALRPGVRKVIVVLVGETSKKLLGRLKEQFRSELNDDLEEKMRLVTV